MDSTGDKHAIKPLASGTEDIRGKRIADCQHCGLVGVTAEAERVIVDGGMWLAVPMNCAAEPFVDISDSARAGFYNAASDYHSVGIEAVHHYSLEDPRDQALYRKGIRVLAELHLAAGAQELWVNTPSVPVFRRGEDLEGWLEAMDQIPIRAGGMAIGSAHQMGTARMGVDPADSVADTTGQLHDARGVWIGDTSAFPTPSGANPMLTCMALAHRTAEHILARMDEPSAEAQTPAA